MTAFDVDLAELRSVVAELAGCQRDLPGLARDIDDVQAQVRHEWEGRASAAQEAAHGAWREEFADMVTALAAMRAVVAAADGHYSSAVQANIARWRQVSA